MLKHVNKQISISAVSSFKDESGEERVALAFYSTIQTDGRPTFNQAVDDMELYENNMQDADADFAEFKKNVMQVVKTHEKGN